MQSALLLLSWHMVVLSLVVGVFLTSELAAGGFSSSSISFCTETPLKITKKKNNPQRLNWSHDKLCDK